MNIAEQLAALAELRDKGVLTPAEFERQKERLLSTNPLATPSLPRAPSMTALGAYDLYEKVGDGGMGRVYRGRHRAPAMATRQGGDVAVKVLHEHLANRPGFLERFRQEAEALAALEHQNIVRIHDVVEDAGQVALVMEWVPGRPLSELIGRETGPIPWERARMYADPLLDAVAHAHARGVVHRDLKPDNIRVTPDNVVKVLDFGIAKMGEGRGRTKTGTGMGTVDYMAPEQYADTKGVDARADVYALGMTLYEMVAGRLPWEESEPEFARMLRKQRGEIPAPTTFYPAIPPWVVRTILEALRPDPAQRLPDVAALRAGMKVPGSNPPTVEPHGPPVQPPPSPLPPVQTPGLTTSTGTVGCLSALGTAGLCAVVFTIVLVTVTSAYEERLASSEWSADRRVEEVQEEKARVEASLQETRAKLKPEPFSLDQLHPDVRRAVERARARATDARATAKQAWRAASDGEMAALRARKKEYGYGATAEGAEIPLVEGKTSGTKFHGDAAGTWRESEWAGNHYAGQYQNGSWNGYGLHLWSSNSRNVSNSLAYIGQYTNDRRHGLGLYFWNYGDRYEGEHAESFFSGSGVYWWANGNRYEGEWQKDKMHGHGVKWTPTGEVDGAGVWSGGLLVTRLVAP